MDAKSISAMEAIRDDPVLAVNLKAGKMLNMLDSLGYIRIQNLKPSQLLVHPENRSGAMVNPFNVHQKGWQALKVGWSAKKLEESYALEVSHNWSVKHKQLQAMQTLVAFRLAGSQASSSRADRPPGGTAISGRMLSGMIMSTGCQRRRRRAPTTPWRWSWPSSTPARWRSSTKSWNAWGHKWNIQPQVQQMLEAHRAEGLEGIRRLGYLK
ncbi:unnamed protein product [Symbiodinium natans]|uniref:Uncharacterized protein n=1 Tax=Symbiodinium natans TaxID=878477 RepID=A0A812U9L4_9DINO|nr:unnamed protein product [Symbiodinium natans]